MTTLTTGPKFDLARFSLAFELHDAQTQLQYYADDAELCILRHGHPDTPPHTVHGRSKILSWLTDLFEDFSQVRAVSSSTVKTRWRSSQNAAAKTAPSRCTHAP